MNIFLVELLDCTKKIRQTSRVASQYTSEAMCLNCFDWTVLHISRAHAYTLCTGRHFNSQSLLYGVATALCDKYWPILLTKYAICDHTGKFESYFVICCHN